MNQISRCEILLISFRLRYGRRDLVAVAVAVVTHASSSTHGIGCFNTLQQTFGPSRAEHQNIAHSFLDSTSTLSLLQNQFAWILGIEYFYLPARLRRHSITKSILCLYRDQSHIASSSSSSPSAPALNFSAQDTFPCLCHNWHPRLCRSWYDSVPHPKMTPAVKYGQIIEYIPGKLSKTPIFSTSCTRLRAAQHPYSSLLWNRWTTRAS